MHERGERFQAAEALREQLMLALSDELPYGIAVEIERFEPTPDGRTEIDAIIWVERVGQRKIVIGAKGARLKAIGSAARLALNELFGRRVHLNTWVKVREGWSDDDQYAAAARPRAVMSSHAAHAARSRRTCCITGPGATRAGSSTS